MSTSLDSTLAAPAAQAPAPYQPDLPDGVTPADCAEVLERKLPEVISYLRRGIFAGRSYDDMAERFGASSPTGNAEGDAGFFAGLAYLYDREATVFSGIRGTA